MRKRARRGSSPATVYGVTSRADTGLWADLLLTPETVTRTVTRADGFDDVARQRIGLKGADGAVVVK